MNASVKFRESGDWATVEVRFPRFAELQNEEGEYEESPVFSCCGNRWSVWMYPRGDGDEGSDSRIISIFLCNRSDCKPKATYGFTLRGPQGVAMQSWKSPEEADTFGPYSEEQVADEDGCLCGKMKFVNRSKVMRSLVEGAMVVDVKIMRIEEMPKSPFFPENPHLKNSTKIFMDKETADVIFQVGIQSKKGKRKRDDESTDFYAHRLVLKHNAPVLAEFCRPGEGEGSLPITVPVEDVDAEIFRHLLYYVYGGEIEGEDLKTRAKEIIDAANRYGVVGLKLLAEARYVESMKLSIENIMEHLLFADAKNCALMKEAVVDFVLVNDMEVLEKVSFDDCPAGLTKDLLAAVARSKRSGKSEDGNAADQFFAMRVDDLRRKLHEKGLDVDGSREAMIAALRESS